jgi:hypothetical protein
VRNFVIATCQDKDNKEDTFDREDKDNNHSKDKASEGNHTVEGMDNKGTVVEPMEMVVEGIVVDETNIVDTAEADTAEADTAEVDTVLLAIVHTQDNKVAVAVVIAVAVVAVVVVVVAAVVVNSPVVMLVQW